MSDEIGEGSVALIILYYIAIALLFITSVDSIIQDFGFFTFFYALHTSTMFFYLTLVGASRFHDRGMFTLRSRLLTLSAVGALFSLKPLGLIISLWLFFSIEEKLEKEYNKDSPEEINMKLNRITNKATNDKNKKGYKFILEPNDCRIDDDKSYKEYKF
jgi:hypothetical protein